MADAPPPDDLPVDCILDSQPNPFRASTTITYILPAELPVTLEVFDPAGRMVATLLREARVAGGVHQLEFRRGDLPCGVYLCRLQAGDRVLSRKMQVLE